MSCVGVWMNEGVSILDLNTEVLLELTLWCVIAHACCWLVLVNMCDVLWEFERVKGYQYK